MKLYRSIISVVFAILVLFSSSSFIVGIHLCCDRVQDVALFTPAEDCGMGKTMPPCHRPESKPCCKNEAIVHSGDDFKASVKGVMLPLVPVMDMELPHVLIAEVIPSLQLTPAEFYNYDPPLRQADLTVSFQVFLI
jgi:hypothetical protein